MDEESKSINESDLNSQENTEDAEKVQYEREISEYSGHQGAEASVDEGFTQDSPAPSGGGPQDSPAPSGGEPHSDEAPLKEKVNSEHHDFDDDEPEFDTQTGERLDKPKKKYPGVLLTLAVTAIAIWFFVYAILPDSLPISGVKTDDDSVETEKITLAIAVHETEGMTGIASEESMTEEGSTEQDTSILVTESESAEHEDRESVNQPSEEIDTLSTERDTTSERAYLSGGQDGEGTEESQSQSEFYSELQGDYFQQTEVMTENGAETETEYIVPEFKTEGVMLSTSLDVSDIIEEVMPSVVSITASSIENTEDFFFGRQQIEQKEACSGFIVDEDEEYYYIVTDALLIEGAEDLTVGFSVRTASTDGEIVTSDGTGGEEDGSVNETDDSAIDSILDEDTLAKAEILGADINSELAVIVVKRDEVKEELQDVIRPCIIGDSDSLRVGERAIAIGNALGYGPSVTQGVISALGREMRTTYGIHEFIQTDASINYGNYGGPLLNVFGEVIGVNAGKVTSESSEGMGYAFPINAAKEAISDIIGDGGTGRALMSDAGEISSEDSSRQGQEGEEQVSEGETSLLSDLTDGGEEENNSYENIETETGSEGITGQEETSVQSGTEETSFGDDGGEETSVQDGTEDTVFEDGSEEADTESNSGLLGIVVAQISEENQIIYRIPEGVYISEVMDGSGAEDAGLLAGDVIVSVNDSDVLSIDDLREVLSGTRGGDIVTVYYIRPDTDGDYNEDDVRQTSVTLQ